MPYFHCSLEVKPPFDVKVIQKLARKSGFAVTMAEKSMLLTTNEASKPALQKRIAALTNQLRTSGHAPNVGTHTISPVAGT